MPADEENLDKRIEVLETTFKRDRFWLLIIIGGLLSFLGYTNVIGIPKEVRDHVRIHVEEKVPEVASQAVDEWFDKNIGVLTATELENRANNIAKMTTEVKALVRSVEVTRLLSKDGWQDARELTSGWENVGDELAPLGYAIDSAGIVYLRGMITGGDSGKDETVIELPPAFRPKYKTQVVVACKGDDACSAIIWKDGRVTLENANDEWTSFDGVSFPSAGSAN